MRGAALQCPRENVSERYSGTTDSGLSTPPTASPGSDPAQAPLELALTTDREAFDALEPEWNELFARAGRSAQLFQAFNWNRHWCNHYLSDSATGQSGLSLAIVTGRRDGRLVMIWPLALERGAGLRRLVWMGAPVSQYGDVLIDAEIEAAPSLLAAWRFVTERLRPDLVWLRKVREDAAIAPIMSEIGAVATQRLEAPYMDLTATGDFEAVLQQRSTRFRKRQRAASKRLAAFGPVDYDHRSVGVEASKQAAHAVALKRAQLKADGVLSPAVADPRMGAFFADVAEASGQPLGLHVVSLSSNNHLAAVDVFLGCKDRAALHVVAYDLEFEQASVGSLLLQQTIAEACAAGYRTFDFLAPADAYKMRWADGVVGVSDWVLPRSAKGRAFASLYLGLARPTAKAAFGALPLAVRRFIARRLFR